MAVQLSLYNVSMKNLTLLLLLSFTTLSWGQAKMHCQSEIRCAVYQDGEFLGEEKCYHRNSSGQKRFKVNDKVSFDLSISTSGEPDIKYTAKANGSSTDIFGKAIPRQWFYHIIQLEEYNNHQYKLKAGVLSQKSIEAIHSEQIKHINLNKHINYDESQRFPDIIADKGQSITKTFDIMVPLDRKQNYSIGSTAKNLLKRAAVMPLVAFKAMKSQLLNGEFQCGIPKEAPLDQGMVLYAKSLTVNCDPIK